MWLWIVGIILLLVHLQKVFGAPPRPFSQGVKGRFQDLGSLTGLSMSASGIGISEGNADRKIFLQYSKCNPCERLDRFPSEQLHIQGSLVTAPRAAQKGAQLFIEGLGVPGC